MGAKKVGDIHALDHIAKPQAHPNKPQDVIRFPWEKEAQEVVNVEPLTEEALSCLSKIFNMKRKDIVNGQDQ